MGGHHSHHHHHPVLSGKKLLLSIVLNSIITVAQLVFGFISGSLALISDAIHNFSDVISLILSYVANRLSLRKKQTSKQTFGYKRAEIIAAFINAITLIVIGLWLAVEAVQRFFDPQIINGTIVIWMAFLGILVNGFSVLLLKGDADHNLNMKSAYLHLLTDLLTSVVVLIGGILITFYQVYWVDAFLTILIAFYLVYMSWSIVVDTLKILMLFAPDHLIIEDIEKEILNISAVKNIHHVHVWQLNDHDCHFEAHIEFRNDIRLSDFDVYCEQLEDLLKNKFGINHVNFQPEFNRDDEKKYIIQD
ncbi:MAG: cation transporter [Flavobacteriaceae bacterium]|nr:MAG: cation transporter [Flavobacteriaceae bacterium]